MQFPVSQAVWQPTRVLIVASEPPVVAPLGNELMRRKALVAVTSAVTDAGAAVRSTSFEFIYITPRAADAETALLIQLLRGASAANPRVLLLIEPDVAALHPMAIAAADDTVSLRLPTAEIADRAAPRVPDPETSKSADVINLPGTGANADAAGFQEAYLPAAQTLARAAEAIARAAESIATRATEPTAVPQVEPVMRAEVAPAPSVERVVTTLTTSEPAPVEVIAPAHESVVKQPALIIEAPQRVMAAPAPVVAKLPELAPIAPPVQQAPAPQAPAPQAPAPAPQIIAPQIVAPQIVVPPAPVPAPQSFAPPALEPVSAPEPVAAPVLVAPVAITPHETDGEPTGRRFHDRKVAPESRKLRLERLFYATGWFLLAGAIIALTTWPISTQAQFTLGLAALAVMTMIRKLRLAGIWRTTFLALGITMILRYVYWRTTTTLPPFHDLMNFTPGFLLFVSEMYCVMMFFISMFIISDPIERKPPPALPDDRLPSVDVFIPTYNEDSSLLATTVAAATQMDYPAEKLNVYLLDDGGTDQKCNQADPEKAAEAIARRAELQALCVQLGITYITRERNEHAKAGNMNNALVQTSSPIIVVFDADHAPARQFLRETVGYFSQDKKLFLVQTPHFFINPDPIEKNLQTFDRMPSENEMFYGTIQKGLDKWNGAFFCGSAALISRRALESVGGFSGLSITEDCETALDLHKRGWNSLYVDKPLIAGLQPESLVSFIGQRSRWCRGMVQILVLKNPLFARNMSLKQRVSYISSMFYWLFPIPRMIFLFSPFLYIFFGMQIFQSNAQEFFSYVTIYMLTHMTIQNYIHGSTRWPWVSEAYEYVQTLYLVKGIWGVLLNPRKPTFNVTAKGLTLDNDHLSELAWPYFVTFGLILLSLVVAVTKFLSSSEVDELLLIVGGWSFYNLIIAGVALGIVAERRERRKTPRLSIARKGELVLGDKMVAVDIIDASIGGMRISVAGGRLPDSFARGSVCNLRVIPDRPDFSTPPIPCTIHNVENDGGGAVYGMKFDGLQPIHFRGIADAMYADHMVFERFRASRRAIKGITMGTLQFLWWSVYHTLRSIYYAIAMRGAGVPKPKDVAQMAITESKGAHPATHEPAPPVEALLHPARQAVLAQQ